MTPINAAPTSSNGEVRLFVMKNAMTMPSRTVWLMASLIIAMRRRTRKTPGSAHATATRDAMIRISNCA
jgi:hypothetical protein